MKHGFVSLKIFLLLLLAFSLLFGWFLLSPILTGQSKAIPGDPEKFQLFNKIEDLQAFACPENDCVLAAITATSADRHGRFNFKSGKSKAKLTFLRTPLPDPVQAVIDGKADDADSVQVERITVDISSPYTFGGSNREADSSPVALNAGMWQSVNRSSIAVADIKREFYPLGLPRCAIGDLLNTAEREMRGVGKNTSVDVIYHAGKNPETPYELTTLDSGVRLYFSKSCKLEKVENTGNSKQTGQGNDASRSEWIYSDPKSNLLWQMRPSDAEMSLGQAEAYCRELELDGISEWHVPSISELRTLVRKCPSTQPGGNCNIKDLCTRESCRTWSRCRGNCPDNQGPANGCYRPKALNGPCTGRLSSTFYEENSRLKLFQLRFKNAAIDEGLIGDRGFVRCVHEPIKGMQQEDTLVRFQSAIAEATAAYKAHASDLVKSRLEIAEKTLPLLPKDSLNNPAVRMYLATFYSMAGRLDDQLSILEPMMGRSGSSAVIYRDLCQAYVLAGRYDDMLKIEEKAMGGKASKTDYVVVTTYRTIAYLMKEDVESAAKSAERAALAAVGLTHLDWVFSDAMIASHRLKGRYSNEAQKLIESMATCSQTSSIKCTISNDLRQLAKKLKK